MRKKQLLFAMESSFMMTFLLNLFASKADFRLNLFPKTTLSLFEFVRLESTDEAVEADELSTEVSRSPTGTLDCFNLLFPALAVFLEN